MRIVIVEDEIRIREGLANLIRKIDPEYEVVGEAKDGLQGVEVVTDLRPDLVITDVRMPDLDGLEMLSRIRANSIMVKAIVLSAYSEFSYACRAIKLGVSEYLLKPINVGDLSKSLNNVKKRIEEERLSRRPEAESSLDTLIRSVALGEGALDSGIRELLAEKHRVDCEGNFALIVLYLGEKYEAERRKTAQKTKRILSGNAGIRYVILESPRSRELLIVAFNIDDIAATRRWFESDFMQGMRREGEKDLCAGIACPCGISRLKPELMKLEEQLDWSIVFGGGTMISWPEIADTPFSPMPYPIQVENRVRSALYGSNGERYEAGIDEFLGCLKSGGVFSPKDIKESFIRFFWAVVNAAREVNYDKYASLRLQEILERIIFSVTWPELKNAAEPLYSLAPREAEGAKGESRIVKLAANLVYELYSQGITLEEIASKINVTPEYLSSQFHRETGEKFSVYIKNFRIQKAKELLIGTDLKLSEVGKRIGYGDAKYFCRVFKEVTGQIPSDYRRTNR